MRTIITYLMTLFISIIAAQSCLAVDVNDDNYDDIFIYYPDTQVVEAYKVSGEYISGTPLPTTLIGSPAIVFAGIQNKKFTTFSILIDGEKANGTLYKIDTEGKVSSKTIGELQSSTIMLEDINDDGNSDLIIVAKTGKVTVHNNVLTDEESQYSFTIPRIKRNTNITYSYSNGIPFLTLYSTKKKKRKTNFRFYSLNSSARMWVSRKRRLKKQLFFHTKANKNEDMHFSEYKQSKSGILRSFGHFSLSDNTYKSHKVPASTTLLPGIFTEAGSALQVFSVSKTAKVFDFSSSLNLISELDVTEPANRQASLLSHPYFSFRQNSAATKYNGCTYTQDGNDGAGGFLLKRSDHDHKLVVLLPINLSTKNTVLTKFNGQVIEDLKFTGRSNGFRETHRGSKAPTAYPKELIVKAILNSGSENFEQSVCYKIYNSHSRND